MNYENAWLAYRKGQTDGDAQRKTIYCESGEIVAASAVRELTEAAGEMLNWKLEKTDSAEQADICLRIADSCGLGTEGYRLEKDGETVVITSGGAQGLLYGSFAWIRLLQQGQEISGEIRKVPSNPLRMMDHWDNLDGSIERGYAGNSFFFKENHVIVDERTRVYARLAASVGINGVVINNVNVFGNATRLLEDMYEKELQQMEAIFAEYGIRMFLSINFASPIELGGLQVSDPCDEAVQSWWKQKAKELYTRFPRLGGFLVKADSEGRPGPFTYGRTHADGANMLADALAPFGGIVIWRCFVYNCQQDWRDRKTDRARAGYDNFKPIDGMFRDNVVLQIKNGPMDFQVREPVSPLFGGLEHTNQMLEVQIAQEYTGQQRHVCYLIPMFREILDFHTHCKESTDTVADIVSGRTYGQTLCGMAAVANTGDDENWTGHDLAAANFFGFGRLSFDTSLSAEEIAEEWIACTFGNDEEVKEKVKTILMMSWPAYEKYTSPLGIGWMVNPGVHYGPNVDGYEYDRWGTYHRADHKGMGVDRSSRGTGYAQQYHEPFSSLYDRIETCPEELLLFFHYVSYEHRLKSGKTLIQHIYDTHFEGVEDAETMEQLWLSLKGKISEKSFTRTAERFAHQAEHAKEWRDQINTYFYRKSMIPDEHGRTIFA